MTSSTGRTILSIRSLRAERIPMGTPSTMEISTAVAMSARVAMHSSHSPSMPMKYMAAPVNIATRVRASRQATSIVSASTDHQGSQSIKISSMVFSTVRVANLILSNTTSRLKMSQSTPSPTQKAKFHGGSAPNGG